MTNLGAHYKGEMITLQAGGTLWITADHFSSIVGVWVLLLPLRVYLLNCQYCRSEIFAITVHLKLQVDFLRSCLVRTRVKVSQALDNLIQHCETYTEYDSFLTGVLPSNPWITDDSTFWQLNSPMYVLILVMSTSTLS